MDIALWQKRIVSELHETFPTRMSTEHRLLALHRQVGEASLEFAREQKAVNCDHHPPHGSFQSRLVAVFLDLFVLCEESGVDVEAELEEAIKWLQSHR